ncbi:MAG: hypothetical protein K2O08_03250 [Clostridia bacterium]|nr:hypothetical protein [Clostridia bacterium]
MGLFRKKQPVEYATLSLNMRLQPNARVAYYEDNIDKVLKRQKIGEVEGGGTEFTKEEGPLSCDVNINYFKDKEQELVELVQKFPMAKGSKLFLGEEGDKEYSVGTLEGLAIYLNGTDLGQEVYDSCDINFVVSELIKLIGEDMATFSFWTGDKETSLYFYGSNYERMKTAIESFVLTYPLCQKCRIEQLV